MIDYQILERYMPSIAVFPQSFTRQTDVLEPLIGILDAPLTIDDDIVVSVATEHNIDSRKLVSALHEKPSVFNQFTLEKERHVNLMKIEIATRLLQSSQGVYVGYHTMLIPRKITHILKILLADEKSVRVAQAISEGYSEKEAKKLVRQSDISSYIWTDFLFKKEAIDRSLYDIILPVSRQSPDNNIKFILENFRKTSVLETEESKQAVKDMLLAARVERALLQKGHTMGVTAEAGNVTLEVNKSVLNFSWLVGSLTPIAQSVEGVNRVEVIMGKEYDLSVYRSQRFELPSKVLLVDDERELIQTLSERLINRDVGTYAVFDGQQALDIVEDDKPEIMVLDLRMPGIDGIEVLRRTKQRHPEIEVIILTGHGTEDDRKICMDLGAYAYLQKPVDLDELSRVLLEAHAKIGHT
jgi:two-component system response regulator CpxR